MIRGLLEQAQVRGIEDTFIMKMSDMQRAQMTARLPLSPPRRREGESLPPPFRAMLTANLAQLWNLLC